MIVGRGRVAVCRAVAGPDVMVTPAPPTISGSTQHRRAPAPAEPALPAHPAPVAQSPASAHRAVFPPAQRSHQATGWSDRATVRLRHRPTAPPSDRATSWPHHRPTAPPSDRATSW